MPIQEQNIVFVESQVMDDVPEGGGAATGRVIVDGQMNNVFEDISDLDRAYGRFNLRKIFLAVRTLSTDLYGGAKTVITALPQDDALGYTLFSSNDPFDTRADAADRVEAYLYKGPTWPGYLYESHITGMRAISVIQRIGSTLPAIGKTLCIVQDEGLAGEKEQYVRVTEVSNVAEVTFNAGTPEEFSRWVVTLALSDALRHDFTGHSPYRIDSTINYSGKARLRDTTVADATRYYGAERLAAAASIGALTVQAGSIFTKLVPSAQTETPLTNQLTNPELVATYSAGARSVEVAQQAHTASGVVTVENRRLNYNGTLTPIPAPGALSIAFRAQGAWYSLVDNGAGNLEASDPAIGSGSINYTTGAYLVTLGALPDVGSQIMIAWASPTHYTSRIGAGARADATARVRYTLASAPVVPGSLSISYPVGGVPRTITDSGANGALVGTNATGTINYATGEVDIAFTVPPDADGSLSNDYTRRDGDVLAQNGAAVVSGGTFTVPGGAPFRNGGTLTLLATNPELGQQAFPAYIAADGQVRVRKTKIQTGVFYFGNRYAADQPIGVFAAATGVVTVTADIVAIEDHYEPSGGVITVGIGGTVQEKEWVPKGFNFTITSASSITVEKDTAGFTPSTVSDELVSVGTVGAAIDLLSDVSEQLVPGSLRFTAYGKTFEDRAGALYTDIDPQTGSGTPAGAVDYATATATLTLWTPGASANVSVSSCLTRYGRWSADRASFRATLSPIKPEALSIAATRLDGTVITGTADANGDIGGAQMRGEVNYEMGTAWVEFGADNAGTWEPTEVMPDTIRYSAVAYSYLPLDADVLGIDPVRLPSDGRVPIFRPGDVVMVMHPAETAPQVVTSGGTINCGRTRIGWVRVFDANGDTVTSGYSLDRTTGIVTIDDATGIAMPVTVRHTVGDLRQITDAQITGALTLARPLTHNYPANESIVASCLIHGDRRARVSAVWDQATWNGTWSDSLAGSEATATLDVIAHPIEVTNEGAETERWLLRWTSTTNVELIGERRGLVFSGPFTADIAPINPRTRNQDGTGGAPYLRIPLAANGGGWSTGNVVRINTVGALADIWIARSIQQSDEPLGDGEDGVELYALGNIDRP